MTDPPRSPLHLSLVRTAFGAWGLVFLLAAPAFFLFYRAHPVLYDADAYYHLAIAREIHLHGLPEQLETLRFSALAEGFGDKELLFHYLLAPFAGGEEPLAGGRWALAFFDAALLAVIAALAVRALGAWGLAVPLLLVWCSPELSWRLVRLRPELLAVSLLLLALAAAGRGRYRTLGALSAIFALSYTAFHAWLGVFGILFLVRGWVRRRWSWLLLLYPALGVGAGLLLHPRFPGNLEIWVLQSIDFFQLKGSLDVGTEIRPNTTDVALLANLGWWLAMICLWRAPIRSPIRSRDDRDVADAFAVGATVFGLLYLLMSRFSLYWIPLATLWLLFEMRARGSRPGGRVQLAGGRTVPLALALAFCLLIAAPEALRQYRTFDFRTDPGPEDIRLRDREQLAEAIPKGARVAAPWRSTPIYMLWAPQGRYLNVLDPVFLARPYPEKHRALEGLWSGTEPDVPWALLRRLESEYLALSLHDERVRELLPRLESDPRLRARYRGINALFEVLPESNQAFLNDWRVLVNRGHEVQPGPTYPRDVDPAGRSIEGYVDLLRMPGGGKSCLTLTGSLELGTEVELSLELASYGPASLSIDDELLLTARAGNRAVLGQGWMVNAKLTAGGHRITVTSCPDASGSHNGFYLLRRGPG